MGREQNKKFEQAVARLLQQVVPELTASQCQPGESPDAVFLVDGERIGLEITSLHGSGSAAGSPEIHRDSARALFFHLVESAIKTEGAPCAVCVELRNPIAGGKRRAIALASGVIRVLRPRLALLGEPFELRGRSSDFRCPPEILSLEVHWPPRLKSPFVLMTGEGFCNSDDFAGPLRQVIETKSQKFGRYRERCDRCWLAVVLPHYFDAEDDGKQSPALAEVYPAPFERAFLVDLDRDRVWELQTAERQ